MALRESREKDFSFNEKLCKFLTSRKVFFLMLLFFVNGASIVTYIYFSDSSRIFSRSSGSGVRQPMASFGSVVKKPEEFAYSFANLSLFPGNRDRYMIYHCQSHCGGWADRLKGIVIAYIIASLTNRKFGIQILDNPCPLSHYLQPNEVNWDLPEDVDLNSEVGRHNFIDSRQFYKIIAKENLDKIFTKRVILFKANLDYFDQIKLNTLYQKQLDWLQPLSYDQIFAHLFRKLFTFSPPVQKALNRSLQLAKPHQSCQLICAHVRFASNSETLRDTVPRHTVAHGDTVLNFLQTFDPANPTYNASRWISITTSSLNNPSNLRFFVTSDSQKYMRKAADIFGNRFVETEGQFVHVDRPGNNSQAVCDGFNKVLVDQQLLSKCDVLVISKSGFARQSAYLRGTDRGLYCILMTGKLRKCSTNKLRELYKILG